MTNVKTNSPVNWVGGLVIGFTLVGNASPVHAQQITPYVNPSSVGLNHEHCVVTVSEPPNPHSTRFPKGTKYLKNNCNYKIYIAWCNFNSTAGFGPTEKGDCGLNGDFLQKSSYLKANARSLSKMDIHQRFYLVACKDGLGQVVFQNPADTSSSYRCKS